MRKIIDDKVTARDGQEVQFTLFDETREKCETFLVEAIPMGAGYCVDAVEVLEFVSDDNESACAIFRKFVEASRKRAPTKCGHYLVCPSGFHLR